jgi:hypothetical protein
MAAEDTYENGNSFLGKNKRKTSTIKTVSITTDPVTGERVRRETKETRYVNKGPKNKPP